MSSVPRVIAFALPEKPLSYNAFRDAERKAAYARGLRAAFLLSSGSRSILDPPCYGLVYHFHRLDDPGDADNISKPVWDALRGLAYDDDAVVRLRVAGKIRIDRSLPPRLNLARVPVSALQRLTRLAGKQNHQHILYVELGTLDDEMVPFGLAG